MNDTAEHLRQIVERYESLAEEKAATAELMKGVMAEAKGNGFDVKALRIIIARRKRRREELAEEEAIVAMYQAALEGGE